MSLVITANIILATITFAVVVGMLAWGIRGSALAPAARPPRTRRAPAARHRHGALGSPARQP
jgi:hypothetical protein